MTPTHQSPIKWPISPMSIEKQLEYFLRVGNELGLKGYEVLNIHIEDGYFWYDMIHKA